MSEDGRETRQLCCCRQQVSVRRHRHCFSTLSLSNPVRAAPQMALGWGPSGSICPDKIPLPVWVASGPRGPIKLPWPLSGSLQVPGGPLQRIWPLSGSLQVPGVTNETPSPLSGSLQVPGVTNETPSPLSGSLQVPGGTNKTPLAPVWVASGSTGPNKTPSFCAGYYPLHTRGTLAASTHVCQIIN